MTPIVLLLSSEAAALNLISLQYFKGLHFFVFLYCSVVRKVLTNQASPNNLDVLC